MSSSSKSRPEVRLEATEQGSGPDTREPASSEEPPPPPGISHSAVARWGDLFAGSEAPAMAAAARRIDQELRSRLPDLPGYQVLAELGSGGMGIVYKAVQKGLGRFVAVKMVLAGRYARPEQLLRFRREAEAVASLRHPNIVQIYEVGEHDGLPYLALEYLDGGSLADRLAQSPLSPKDAAELVETIARAVHTAHQHGIIHRDLKPSNILLDAAAGPGLGLPKISDFGLAKRVGTAGPERTEVTLTGAVLGTSCYMAPEQAAGQSDSVGPAADIYALGAILYEAITGRAPFRAASTAEILEQVRSHDPMPPSELQPKLPRDLETICLKCLEKQPGRRYDSALDLADDLARFRNGRPIIARPVARSERCIKWVRRNPAKASFAAVTCAATLTLLLGALWHNARLRQEIARTAAQEEEARRQQRRAGDQYRSARNTVNRMLDQVQSSRMGDLPKVRQLRQALLQEALAFYQETIRQVDNPDAAIRFDVALAHQKAGTIQLQLGEFDHANKNLEQARDLFLALAAEQPEVLEHRVQLAVCHNNLGNVASSQGQLEESQKNHEQALRLRQELVRARPESAEWQNDLAKSYHNTGVAHQLQGRAAEARTSYGEAVAIRMRLVDQHPEVALYRAQLAEAFINLGLIYYGSGETQAGEDAFGDAEQYLQPLGTAHPEEADYAVSLAATYANWGNLLKDTGRPEESLAKYERALQLLAGVLDKEPRDARARSTLLNVHGARALALEAIGRYSDAVGSWEQVVELADGPSQLIHQCSLAMALARSGDHRAAAREMERIGPAADLEPEWVYRLACAAAQALEAALADETVTGVERTELTDRYAAEAFALIDRAREAGYFREPQKAEALMRSPDLDPLRGRPEWEQLMAPLAHSAEPSGNNAAD